MACDSILKSLIAEDLSGTLGLAAPGGWQPNATIALAFDGGQVELSTTGWNVLFSNPIATGFAAGSKYFFGFQVLVEHGTYFNFLQLTNVNQAWHSPSSTEAWQLVGATFDVPDRPRRWNSWFNSTSAKRAGASS